MFSALDITERNEETRQLGIIVGSSVGGVVLIAALLVFLTCCVCLIVNCRKHSESKMYEKIAEVAITKDKNLDEVKAFLRGMKEDYKQQDKHGDNKQPCKTRKTCIKPDSGELEEGPPEEMQTDKETEDEKRKLLSEFFKEMRKLPVK